MKIILIGDSIRIGYKPVVARLLSGEAEVWAPDENGQTSANVLAHLDAWVLSRKPDIVHLNCGLHDIKRPFDTQALQIPAREYAENLRSLFTRIGKETGATLLWASTTPVNQERHHRDKGFDRREADVVEYNAIAASIAGEFEVPVNDLYSIVMSAGRDKLLLPDGVHYTGEGYNLLGSTVASFIGNYIASVP